MSDPVVHIEYQFDALKSFMNRQPSNWAPTGDPAIDAARKVRFQLSGLKHEYATSIDRAIKNAAEIYHMNPKYPRVKILNPQTPYDQINARQQKRIVELNDEFRAYVRKHCLYIKSEEEEALENAPKWFFYEGDVKQGPISDKQVKEYINENRINHDTVMETLNGRQGKAHQIKGLFPDQPSTPRQQPVVSSQLMQGRPETSNIRQNQQTTSRELITILTTKSENFSESKLKSRFWGWTCSASLALLIFIWITAINEKSPQGPPSDAALRSAVLISIPIGTVILISFCFWFVAVLAQQGACPSCKALDAGVQISYEKRNKRHIIEKEPVTVTNSKGETFKMNQYNEIKKTKYDTVAEYKCKFCGHEWNVWCRDLTTDGWV